MPVSLLVITSEIVAEKNCVSLPPLEYSTLEGPDGFRVLRLQPGSFSDPIRCILSVHCLRVVPDYEALSYTWGDNIGHDIECNDKSLFITENLCSALRRLRRETTVRLLWIDAVCINQSDVAERNQQLNLMQDIYRNAARVVVWLGKESVDSSMAFQLLSQINALQDSSNVWEWEEPLQTQHLTDIGLPEPSSLVWRALDALCWRDWFTRVWIIQEVTLAKEVMVACGNDQISWRAFEACAKFILQHSLVALTDVDPKRIVKLANFRAFQVGKGRRDQLLILLTQARDSYATGNRDKIYAILGLATEDDRITLNADYLKSVDEIYTSFAAVSMERYRNLDVLNAVQCHLYSLNSKLPTWVPDWEVHPVSRSFVLDSGFPNMSASNNSQPIVSFSQNNRILFATGVLVDTLYRVGDTFHEYVPLPGSVRRQRSRANGHFARELINDGRNALADTRWGVWEVIAHKIKHCPSGEDVFTTYIRTLIADSELETDAISETYRRYYVAWLRYWTALKLQENPRARRKHYSPPHSSQEDKTRAAKFMELHHRAAYGRRFFTSKQGYMGLGPVESRYGCVIVVLLGGRTPYILRKHGKHHYRFVGECFVHGLMNGEALNRDNNNHQVFAIE